LSGETLIHGALSGDVGWLSPIVLIIWGLAFLILGKAMLRILAGLSLGLTLSYFTAKLILALNGGLLAALLLGFLAFVVGAFLGWILFKLSLAVIAGLALSDLLLSALGLHGSVLIAVLILLLSVGLMYLLADALALLVAYITGLILFSLGIYLLTSSVYMALAFSLILLIILSAVKLWGRARKEL